LAAYYDWEIDIGGRCSDLYPLEFVDEFLLICIFPHYIDGDMDSDYPNQAFCFPIQNLPNSWISYAAAGAVRLQTLGYDLYRVWLPYHFLMMWMKAKIARFDFQDVESLRCEIYAGFSAPTIRKGYCFQRAGMIVLST
jgi:hypothetical protein